MLMVKTLFSGSKFVVFYSLRGIMIMIGKLMAETRSHLAMRVISMLMAI